MARRSTRAQAGDEFVAKITLLSDLTSPPGVEPPPDGGEPPEIWPGPGPLPHPEHPIYWPPGIWPPPGRPVHPIVIPPGFINPDPPVPTHPIVLPPPENTEPPPHVEHPIVPTPEHPIYFPKPPEFPPILGDPHPEHPIYFPVPPPDGGTPPSGGKPPYPAHPIVLPPAKGIVVNFPDYAGTPAPPDGVPKDYVPALLWYGPGTVAMVIWVPPVPPTPKK